MLLQDFSIKGGQHADRDAILRIKHVICQHPDYRGNLYNSMAIYRAVLADNVESVNEFITWVEKNLQTDTR